jgi:hypothetical protein
MKDAPALLRCLEPAAAPARSFYTASLSYAPNIQNEFLQTSQTSCSKRQQGFNMLFGFQQRQNVIIVFLFF